MTCRGYRGGLGVNSITTIPSAGSRAALRVGLESTCRCSVWRSSKKLTIRVGSDFGAATHCVTIGSKIWVSNKVRVVIIVVFRFPTIQTGQKAHCLVSNQTPKLLLMRHSAKP